MLDVYFIGLGEIMGNRAEKPKKDMNQLVSEMKDSRGINFIYFNEDDAVDYLTNVNNYLRTAAYRKNYIKYKNGLHIGKYINLDFAYLVELSIIDMHYRFLIQKMCSDIEHSICVQLIRDIEKDVECNGYDIVKQFLDENQKELEKIVATINSPHTGDLLKKYFTVRLNDNNKHEIENYEECPVWVLMELLSFGSIINFYLYYYESKNEPHIKRGILNLIRNLRNAAAHNNCIIYDLNKSTTSPPSDISQFVSKIDTISKERRKKQLTSRAILEFVTLMYIYDKCVHGKVKKHRFREINELINNRLRLNKDYFRSNDLLCSAYNFVKQVTDFVIMNKSS